MQEVQPLSEFLTRAQAARATGLSGERISQMARNGQIRFVLTPLGRLYPTDEVDRIRAQRCTNKLEVSNDAA